MLDEFEDWMHEEGDDLGMKAVMQTLAQEAEDQFAEAIRLYEAKGGLTVRETLDALGSERMWNTAKHLYMLALLLRRAGEVAKPLTHAVAFVLCTLAYAERLPENASEARRRASA